MRIVKILYSIILGIIGLFFGRDNAKMFDSKIRFNRTLNLKNPCSLADKVSYIELHDCNSLRSLCTDKWEVREYISNKGLENILVPLIGGPWNSFEEINFEELQGEYVLKATHGCKMNYIVDNGIALDKEKCKKEIKKWLGTTYGKYSMEPHYYKIPHRIYAEKFLGNMSDLIDYKFHCINGKPDFVIAITDRKVCGDKAMEVTINLFDMNWNPMFEVVQSGNEKPGLGNVKKPKHFDEMCEIARILSKDFEFVRVDLYDMPDGILFGELTFSPATGVFPYLTEKFLNEEGEKLQISMNY